MNLPPTDVVAVVRVGAALGVIDPEVLDGGPVLFAPVVIEVVLFPP